MASSVRDRIHRLPDQKITLTHLPAQLCTPHFLVLPKYADPGASYYEERYRQRVVANLRRRATSMGFVLQEAAPEGVS